MENFKLTHFPPELIEKFLSNLDPKSISEMKLVCTKFYNVFSRDKYYKAYLIYPEEEYESDLKFKSPAKGVDEIVENIKNGDCGKWEGFLKLQKAHLDNLKSSRFECSDVVTVEGRTYLEEYFESSDADNGRWLICKFSEQVIFVNMATRQKLDLCISDCTRVLFKHGIVILIIGYKCKYSFYKLISKGGEYSLKHTLTSEIDSLLTQVGVTPDTIFCVNFTMGILPRVLVRFDEFISVTKNLTINLLVLDVQTERVTHASPIEVSPIYFTTELVMPSPSIVHAIFTGMKVKSFKLHPSLGDQFGKVECFWTLDLLAAPSGQLDLTGNNFILLKPTCLVWTKGSSESVLKIARVGFQNEEQTFLIPPNIMIVGFLSPDIVLTLPHLETTSRHFVVQGRRLNDIGNVLFDWKFPSDIYYNVKRNLRNEWIYPARKVVLFDSAPIPRPAENPFNRCIFKIHFF